MALTVGELNAVLSVDDRAVDPALRRTEQAIRQSGQRMGSDAESAGADAGRQLGQGLVRGADGQWRTMRGELVDAVTAAAAEAEAEARRGGRQVGARFGDGVQSGARQAGDDLADGVRRGASDAADAAADAGDQAGDGFLSNLGGRATQGIGDVANNLREGLGAKLGLAAIGASAGAALMAGIAGAMEQERITGRLAAQLGKTPAEARRYGEAAGELYARAVVDNFQEGADAMRATASAGLVPSKATIAQLTAIGTKVTDVAKTFDFDLGETATAVGQLIRTKMAKDASEGLDLLAKALGGTDKRAEDILETVTEYAPVLRGIGLDGKTAFGLIRQGAQAGAKDTDKVADALKELSLQATSGSTASMQSLKDLGLNATQVSDDIAAGGGRARKGMDKVLDALRKMPASTKRAQAIQNLFGGPGEDLGAALFALDVDKASESMDGAAGSADRLGSSLRDNAATELEQFKRGIQQGFISVLGGALIKIEGFGSAVGHMWDQAGKASPETADRIVAFFGILGQKAAAKVKEMTPLLINTMIGVGQDVAAYITANPESVLQVAAIAGAIALAVAQLPPMVLGALITAGDSMITGFVSGLITAAQQRLPEWWASMQAWFGQKAAEVGSDLAIIGTAMSVWFGGLWSRYIAGPVERQWTSFLASVSALPGRATGALGRLGAVLAALSSSAWQRFKDAAAAKGQQFIGWVTGLPGRIAGSLHLDGLLTGHGRALVQGLWAGVSSMGGWIKSKLSAWAADVIPGPIAKALGIHSPSRVTKAQGVWIAKGLIEGLTGSEKQIKSASGKLADIIADSLKRGAKRSRALATLSTGTKQLLKLASQEEKVAARLKDAQKKLSDQIAARDKLAADVRTGILNSGAITGQSGSQSPEAILARLQRDRKAAEAFAKNIATLKKKGIRSDLLSQIAQAGVDQGGAVAASLASATPAQIKAITAEQAKLTKAAGAAGTTVADAMYGAGIRAAQGLVKGLKDQQTAIERQMLAIAKGMSKSIRKALGIKSPSRVMARVGAYTAEGLRRGIESGRKAVNRSMSSLVDTPIPRQFTAPSTAAAQGRRVVNNTTQNTYNLQHREMTIRDLETLQRRQDALARVGRPR